MNMAKMEGFRDPIGVGTGRTTVGYISLAFAHNLACGEEQELGWLGRNDLLNVLRA